jgi:hypothetical protein
MMSSEMSCTPLLEKSGHVVWKKMLVCLYVTSFITNRSLHDSKGLKIFVCMASYMMAGYGHVNHAFRVNLRF